MSCFDEHTMWSHNFTLSIQVVNKIQKLRKVGQLEHTDLVDVYYKSEDDNNTLQEILQSQVS